MGNTSTKSHLKQRNKKVHWKATDRPGRPGKPELVSDADTSPDVLTIRWDRPLKDGGSAIIGYLVEHRRFGSPHWVRATPMLVPFSELTLSGLEPGWRYQFRVCAENAVGLSDPSELSDPLIVTLQRSTITTPRFTQELKDTIALENDKIEFVVHFLGQPPPKVSWFKDGFEIFSSRRIRILTESDRSVLTIHQCQLVDAGEIKCTATNKSGHASTRAILTLEAPPSIRLPRQYEEGLLFEIGEVMRLKVSVVGLPTPLVFWSHNGESIQNSERYEIENYDNISTLRINEATRSDRGEYQIKAVNKLGQDTTSFLVTVTDKPSAPSKARVVMTLGKSVTLSWNTPEDDGGCKIGSYIIEYYRIGWDVWLKAATSRQLSTVLGDLIEGSEYKFRIKAESPYGISEPSDETETIFIPDVKRGIIEPRSLSQPREIMVEHETPTLPQRKHKQRSQSSTRAEMHVKFQTPEGTPLRPERTKVKTPQRTPEPSPRPHRREMNQEIINRAIFDRASMTRDLAYGTPDFKIKKTDVEKLPKNVIKEDKSLSTRPQSPPVRGKSRSKSRSKSPSPAPNIEQHKPQVAAKTQNFPVPKKERSPSPYLDKSRSSSPGVMIERRRSPSPSKYLRTRSPSPNVERKTSKDFTGSSEFMLVLLPHENKHEDHEDHDYHFEDNIIPPPLSLSAPELGSEPPFVLEGLKYSASSSELLHERSMMRFYEAAMLEEQEKTKKDQKRPSLIPKIQINDNEISLERKLSQRRRFSAGSVPQHLLWTQKRHSLRNSGDINEVWEGKLRKFPLTTEEKRDIMMNKKRSESEEKEEEMLEKIRAQNNQRPKLEKKRNIDIIDMRKWDEDLSEESSDERIYDQVPDIDRDIEEEDITYNPFMRRVNPKEHEPFEILTKPNKLPDPNFKPKPILKKNGDLDENGTSTATSRSVSMSPETISVDLEKRKSLPKISPTRDLEVKPQQRRSSSPAVAPIPFQTVSAIASISGYTAAGIVIPEPLLSKQKYEEESKVVIDHYADIVKAYSKKDKPIQKYERFIDTEKEEKIVESKSSITDSSSENIRNVKLNGRSRNDSSSSSQGSLQSRSRMRRGSPVVLNKEILTFRSTKIKEQEEQQKQQELQERQQRQKHSQARNVRTPSKSPGRRKTTPSPMRKLSISSVETVSLSTQTSVEKPPSPVLRIRAPKMKEIMTQTSTCIDNLINEATKLLPQKLTDEELKISTERRVRSTIDYITDVTMFIVACWLYMFNNELLAIPVLLVMVYRQLQSEVKKRIPKWLEKKLSK
nr:titin homolog [Onthophagus taurus]